MLLKWPPAIAADPGRLGVKRFRQQRLGQECGGQHARTDLATRPAVRWRCRSRTSSGDRDGRYPGDGHGCNRLGDADACRAFAMPFL